MPRELHSELLDELPPSDPAAMHSRRDLRRVNWFMGNARILARTLRANIKGPPRKILELGAGDGHLLLQVARKLRSAWNGPVEAALLDRQRLLTPAVEAQFATLGWTAKPLQLDLMDWASSTEEEMWDLVLCNLFLHHFSDEQLRRLFERIARCTKCFIATEPRRSRFAPAGSQMLFLLGCNFVTLHDAAVSIRAGFRDAELSPLWPDGTDFQITERAAGLFTHLFFARR